MISKLQHSLAIKGLTWFLLILVLDSAALILFFQLQSTTESQSQALKDSLKTSLLTNELANTLLEVDTSFGRFTKTGDPQLLGQIGKSVKKFNNNLNALKIAYQDRPEQLAIIKDLEKLKINATELMQQTSLGGIYDNDKRGLKKFSHGVDQAFQPLAKKLQADVAYLMRKQLEEQEEYLTNQSRTHSEFKYLILFGCLGNMILFFAISVIWVKNISNRLSTLVDNMMRFENNMALRPLLTGSDEIVFLDRKFHEMSETINLNRQRERIATDYAADLFLSFDQFGKIQTVSQASVGFWGYEPEALIGREVLETIAPECRKEFAECSRVIKATRSKKNFEGHVVTLGGTRLDTLWTFNWVEEENLMFCVAHDISERKRSERLIAENERRIRTIIEKIPVGIAVLNSSGRLLFLNEVLLQMLGATLEQLSTRTLTDFFESTQQLKIDLSREELPRGAIEAAIGRPMLPSIPVEVSFSEISLQERKAVLCTILDVSERKKIEAAREQFLHMITHDMRTPLTSARGYFQLMEAGFYDGQEQALKTATDRASRNISEVIDLISNLLDINKLKADNFELQTQSAKVSTVVASAISSVAGLAAAKGVTIFDHRSEQIVEMDEKLIGRTLVNLLSNAIKFSPPASEISVSTKKLSSCVQIAVKDEGIGIAPEDQERIFETYTQAKIEDFQAPEGTGLGLAICKRIVEAHGGAIGVESIEGSGSIFWFTLPLRPSN